MTDELIDAAETSTRSSFFLISGTAISTIILAISSIIIARLLGPDLYGLYTLALVAPQLLLLFIDLGIDQGILKFTASLRAKGEINHSISIIRHGLLIKVLTGTLMFIINYALADHFASFLFQRPELTFYIKIASTSILFQVLFTTASSAFIGLDKTEYTALTTNINAIAKTIIQITLVLIGFSIAGAIMGHVIGYLAAAIISIAVLLLILHQKQNHTSNEKISDNFRTLIRYGMPLYISVLLTGFIPIFQSVILAIFATDADIGNYKAATNFAVLITVVTVPISTALLPAFSKLESSTKEKIKTFFKLANKYTALLIVPITTAIIIFSKEIVQIIYGSTYESAPIFLASYSLLYFLVGLGYLTLTSFYNGLGETKTTLKISLITFITLTILTPILTRTYGVTGLITAFLLASTAGTIYASYTARKKFNLEFDSKALTKIYAISLASSILPMLILQTNPLPKYLNLTTTAFLYLLTYITLIPATATINQAELATAARVLQKIKHLKPLINPLIKYQQKFCR
jgi:O-antigen/teichoic acid export membrane protein